jgi:hypothetical protein
MSRTRDHSPRPRWHSNLLALILLLFVTAGVLVNPAPATAAGPMPTWQLPFEAGQRWQAGAPHTAKEGGPGAMGSLDFGPISGSSSRVVSAAAGTVYKIPCGSAYYLGVDHGNGWRSTYYHLVSQQGGLIGRHVPAGTFLGNAGTATHCGGSASFPHVHLTILRDGAPAAVSGFAFGGYRVYSSGTSYTGYWVDAAGRRVVTNNGGAACCLQSTTNADTTTLVGGNVAALSTDGTFYAKQGGLSSTWLTMGGGISSVKISGNNVLALTSSGVLLGKEGGFNTSWLTLTSGIKSFDLS